MLTINQFKNFFAKPLLPLVKRLHHSHITANQITLASMTFCTVIGFVFTLWPNAPLIHGLWLFVLLARLLCNMLDGALARYAEQTSTLGHLLNEIGDGWCDSVLYLPLALVTDIYAPLIIFSVALGLIVEIAGLTGPSLGKSRRMDGPMGKVDRLLFFVFLGALLLFNVSTTFVNSLLVLYLIALGATIAIRTVQTIKET